MPLESLLRLLKVDWVAAVRQENLLKDVLEDLVDPALQLFVLLGVRLVQMIDVG